SFYGYRTLVSAPRDFRLDALRHDRPELDVAIGAHEERMWRSGPARFQRGQPLGRRVEDRMVLHFDVDLHLLRRVEIVGDRFDVLLESWRRDPIRRQDGAAEEPHDVRLSAVLDWKDEG